MNGLVDSQTLSFLAGGMLAFLDCLLIAIIMFVLFRSILLNGTKNVGFHAKIAVFCLFLLKFVGIYFVLAFFLQFFVKKLFFVIGCGVGFVIAVFCMYLSRNFIANREKTFLF